MENYIVSARKYRPSTFKTVVGQRALTHTLKSAIDSGRLAHAYLFCGPRGVGKTSCARIFAKTINCLTPGTDGEACNECESCIAFNEQRSYNIIELDAASNNSVDDIRNLTDQVRVPPQIGKYRVFIIDEVHMLSTQAFNAFLKTLEEPPVHAIFILATTEKHKILPTILSRCQIYDFSRITIQDIVEQLQYIATQEGMTTEPTALNVIAQKADGAMRDALSIFDQVAASAMGNITYRNAIDNLNVLDYEYYFRLVDYFLAGDVPQSLLIYKEIRDNGFDSLFFINGLASHIRDLMVAGNPATISLLEVSKEVAQQYINQSSKCSPAFFYKAMDICNTSDINYRTASNKQFFVELSLIKLCQLTNPTPEPSGDTIKKVEPSQSIQANIQSTPQPPNPPAIATDTKTPYNVTPVSATPNNVTSKTTPRFSIRVSGTNNENNTTKAPTESIIRNVEFTDAQMITAWNDFIAQNPTRVILTNAMRASMPQRIGNNKLSVQVDNIGQMEIVNIHISELVNFLRTQLSNNDITLEVKISDSGTAPRILSPTDIVTEMMTKNNAVKELIQTFELGLS